MTRTLIPAIILIMSVVSSVQQIHVPNKTCLDGRTLVHWERLNRRMFYTESINTVGLLVISLKRAG